MIRVRPMTVADIPFGLRLSDAAGWNQIAADWQRLLDLQLDGCFVAENNGEPVGTTAACIFGSVAWIAMVLVVESARGRGVGTALMNHALTFLDERGVSTVRLDARPMGEHLYERLGLMEQYGIVHYEGILPAVPESAWIEDAPADRWEALMEVDEHITRTHRSRLLSRLFADNPQSVRFIRQGGQVEGYLTVRPGKKTMRLGPCIATANSGPLLLADACHRYTGHLASIDVPTGNETARRWVESHGLTVQHTLVRMGRGKPVCEQVESLWASSGPEKG
jgi:GNAT superfamily N-acetyltransferase